MILIQKLAQRLIWLTLIVVPFQSLWLRIVYQHGLTAKPFFVLSFWYEGVFLLILLGALLVNPKKQLRFTPSDYLALGTLILAIFSIFWSHHSLGDHIIGLRYGVPVLYAYLAGRVVQVDFPTLKKILSYILMGVVCFSALQLIVWLLPFEHLWNLLGWAKTFQIPGPIAQVYGSLPGPNQLAAFLAAASFILWPDSRSTSYKWWIYASWFLVILTFSRSSLIGLVIGLIALPILQKAKAKEYLPALAVLIGAILVQIGAAYISHTHAGQVFSHGASQDGHVASFRDSIAAAKNSTWWAWLIGHGVGTAGPATLVRGVGFIPESWLFQAFYELGLLGFAGYLAIFILGIRKAKKSGKLGVSAAIVALVVSSLFLHILADNPAAIILLGLTLAAI